MILPRFAIFTPIQDFLEIKVIASSDYDNRCYRLGSLNNKCLFLKVLETKKSKIWGQLSLFPIVSPDRLSSFTSLPFFRIFITNKTISAHTNWNCPLLKTIHVCFFYFNFFFITCHNVTFYKLLIWLVVLAFL